ncbi:MAG: hypothetical protein IAF94_05555 [Pirellulaceae bacterium]|nr:hypothetical protein [Pirellulaceae bacterium]
MGRHFLFGTIECSRWAANFDGERRLPDQGLVNVKFQSEPVRGAAGP